MIYPILSAEEAAEFVQNGFTVGVSGFTSPGCPQAVPVAIAERAKREHAAGREFKINLFSGASTSDHIDGELTRADALNFRTPYQSHPDMRKAINANAIHYNDRHLSELAQEFRYGFYGKMDIAIVEAQSITDDGELLSVSEPFTAKWLTKADTLYRCALYYNKVKEDNGKYAADVVSAGQVPCPLVTPLSKLETSMRTDPVKFESAWMSKSGKYINLSLYLMTGSTTDKDAIQHLAIVQDTVMENPDHTRTAYLRLYHDQGGIPEYYSTQVYTSILTKEIDADSVSLTINTYKGSVIKSFSLR